MGYIIDIKTVFDIDGQLDDIQVTSPAEYFYTPEKQIVVYTEQNDEISVQTTVTVTPQCVDISRDKEIMPGLHLCVGETVKGRIETGYGTIFTTCETQRVLSKMRPDGGMVFLEYVIDIGGALSHNRVNIKIRKTSDI